MARETGGVVSGTLRMSIAAGALVGVVAATHDVLLKGGDLTGDLPFYLSHWAIAIALYVPVASLLAIPVVLFARPFAGVGSTAERRPAIGAWWLAAAALLAVALALPLGGEPSTLTLLGYAALVPIALLGIRALNIAARSGADGPQIAGLYAGGIGLAIAGFVAVRAANSSLPIPAALGWVVVLVATALGGFVTMVAVRALLTGLSGRLGYRPAVAWAGAVLAALVAITAVIGLSRELGQGGLGEQLAALREVPPSSTNAPSVILISVDTLRADHVGYMGGPARTPTMNALADESWVFESAYSVAPWTRPSFASFFSSRYPSEMGVARAPSLFGSALKVIPFRWAPDAPLLGELLRDHGYATGAVVANPNLSVEAGAARGFDAFYNCQLAGDRKFWPGDIGRAVYLAGFPTPIWTDFERADTIAVNGTRLLNALVGANGPVLAWLHFMDPHDPYDSPQAEPDEAVDMTMADANRGFSFGSAAERTRARRAYVAEIEYFDDWLGDVVDALHRSGMWDRSVVVFWSDHGEEFWEHERWGHGQSLHNELLHVPLMIHLPGQTVGQRVAQPVSLLDVAPTLLELCGSSGAEGMHGRSLVPVLEGRPGGLESLSVYLEGCLLGGIQKGLLRGRYKLIHDLYADTYELYDLEADPREDVDLYGTPGAPDVAQMRDDLAAFTEESLATMEEHAGQQQADEVSPEVLQGLRDMGYIQ